ncbi:hypothetical protein BLNAU_2282 [Blattamonas nauphoetae]|uniref:Protein kinase domain-containing protein n=1 Tax=Blattamonas nauphoetae TaxID=2049346 RepID=A0ABQ9YGG1_9EUKA|nr:hypothetical protein BLNAU_2282 [Blattamonas nauphoetae]
MASNVEPTPNLRRYFISTNNEGSLTTLTSSSLVLSDCSLSISGSTSPFMVTSDPCLHDPSTLSLIHTEILSSDSQIGPLSHIIPSTSYTSFDITVVSSSFDSMCVLDGSTNQQPLFSTDAISQRSIGSTVTHSIGALQGSILSDFNFGGSLLCSNTTFAKCTTASTAHQDVIYHYYAQPFLSKTFQISKPQLSFENELFSGQSKLIFWSHVAGSFQPLQIPFAYTTTNTPITFVNCSFTDLLPNPEHTEFSGGLAIFVQALSPLTVSSCTFSNLSLLSGMGAAILVEMVQYTSSLPQATIEQSSFTNCSSLSPTSGSGGAVNLATSGKYTITSSSFLDCSCSLSGGACCIETTAFSFCRFVGNKASSGGGIYCPRVTYEILFCDFRKNEAAVGKDVHMDYLTYPLLFGCTRSDDDWEGGAGLVVVTGSGSGEECSSTQPCQYLSSAVSKAKTIGVGTIHVGEGSIGSTTVEESDSPLIIRGHYLLSEAGPDPLTSSFSVACGENSEIMLDSLSLSPMTGTPILVCESTGAIVTMSNCHFVRTERISAPLVEFSDGLFRLNHCSFEHLFDVTSQLLSFKDSAAVTLETVLFHNIESTTCIITIAMSDGNVNINSGLFHTITRSTGEGAAAVDVTGQLRLSINSVTFSHCVSKKGKVGAVFIDCSREALSFNLGGLYVANEGASPTDAHDVFINGLTSNELSWISIGMSSLSASPSILDGTEDPPVIPTPSNLSVADYPSFSDFRTHSFGLFRQDLETIHLSPVLACHALTLFFTVVDKPINFIPISVHAHSLSLVSQNMLLPILQQSLSSAGTLFTLTNGTLIVSIFRIIVSGTQTEPLITVDHQSRLQLQEVYISSDDTCLRRPLIRSSGAIVIDDFSVVDISFDGCSCVECLGGTFITSQSPRYQTVIIGNLSTTSDGAFLNAQNTVVRFSYLHIFDCRARNGGAAFLRDCTDLNLHFLVARCSAEERGGACCIDSSVRDAQIQLLPHFVNCTATLGGGLFVNASHHRIFTIGADSSSPFQAQTTVPPPFQDCSAEKGGGVYFDGEWDEVTQVSLSVGVMSNGGTPKNGQDLFFSQSFAMSLPSFETVKYELKEYCASTSSRSTNNAASIQTVEVENQPDHSFTLSLPRFDLGDHTSQIASCVQRVNSSCNSLHHYLPTFHTKDQDDEYIQIPIYLHTRMYFFETGVVRAQSTLITPYVSPYWQPSDEQPEYPVEQTVVEFGDTYWKADVFFLRVEKEGSVELNKVPFVWNADVGLCEMVDGSGKVEISSCSFTLNTTLTLPIITCSAGSLLITQTSILSIDPSSLIICPLISSSPLSSFLTNAPTADIRIEMDGVVFSDLKVDESVRGIVHLEGADSLRLNKVDFLNVLCGSTEAVRFVVFGSELWRVVEHVANCGFPLRKTGVDGLYQTLDVAEPSTSPFHSPTLLLYLHLVQTESVLVSSVGRDGVWCGESDFPCRSLNEADVHLVTADPSRISIEDSGLLFSELDLTQDKTKITTKGGEKCRVDVSKDGCLVNQAAALSHSLSLESVALSLTTDRTNSLLISRSGTLTVMSCSFTSSATLSSKLVEVTGGTVKIVEVDFSTIAFSDTLLSFSSFVSVALQKVAHKSCSSAVLMSFEGKDTATSAIELRDCVFKGVSPSASNEESICEWNTGLIHLKKCSFEGFSSVYSHLPQGALRITDSVVSLKQSQFEVNGPRVSSFPSLNWHIGCFGTSEVELDSSSSSNWISGSGACVVKRSDDSLIPHPLFIPTLLVSSCSSKLDKKAKQYSVTMSGTTLIPCGLSFLVEESNGKAEGKSISFPLPSSLVSFHNESSISLAVPASSFSQFDSKQAWKGSLSFGENGQTDSFIFKRTDKETKAETMGKILPWLIPLIVSLCVLLLIASIVFILCRRRGKTDQASKMSEMNEQDTVQIDEKDDDEQGTQLGVHVNDPLNPRSNHECEQDTIIARQPPSTFHSRDNLVEALHCGEKLEMTTVRECDTLYNVLHVQKEKKTTIVKRVIERQLAQGLEKVATASINATVLTKLSSHWVMFDSNGSICLKTQDSIPHHSLQNQNQSQDNINLAQEAQRWKAPEVVKAEENSLAQKELDPRKAAVFSLGLVLLEIETGCVPFGEQDATNAQRSLGTGARPQMVGVRDEMKELIEQCLNLNPDDRPTLSAVASCLASLSTLDESMKDEAASHK